MKIDHAKIIRLQEQSGELRRTASSTCEEALDARQRLRELEAEWEIRVERSGEYAEAARTDPLSAMNWPGDLKQHVGLDPRLPYELVAMRARVAELERRRAASSERSNAYGVWFGPVLRLTQQLGVYS